MPWNIPQNQPQGLPFPADQIMQGAWIQNPQLNPPPCPISAPGGAAGMERNVLALLLSYLQENAGVSPIRCFAYNFLSRNSYQNEQFLDLLNTILILTAALMDSGKFQRGSQAAEFAVRNMVDYQYINLAERFPQLQDMEPEMASEVMRIREAGVGLGNLVKQYKTSMQQQQQYGPRQGSPYGGGGQMSQQARFHAGGGQPQPATWPPKPPPQAHSGHINTDIYQTSADPRQPDAPIRRTEPMPTSSLTDFYTPRPSEPIHAGTPAPVRTAPRPTEHPTGNTAHVRQPPEDDQVRWMVNSDNDKPEMLDVSPNEEGRQILLYDRQTMLPAFCVQGNEVIPTTTEREVPMSAGYELHELTFKNRDGMFYPVEKKVPINVLYHRDRLLKTKTTEELEEIISYYQETLSGGKINDLTMVSLGTMRDAIGSDEVNEAVLVVTYEEHQTIRSNKNLKPLLESLTESENPETVIGHMQAILAKDAYLGRWVTDQALEVLNKVLKEDFNLSIRSTDVMGDLMELNDPDEEDLSLALKQAIKVRFRDRMKNFLGNIGYIEGAEDEWGVCSIERRHRIIDIPLVVEALELSDGDGRSKGRGRITKTTAPVLWKLIEGAMGESPDHYCWLHTFDGTIIELVPPVGKSSDWLLVRRDHMG